MPQSGTANGSIAPLVMVKIDSTDPAGGLLQCGAGDRAIGVSQAGTRRVPGDIGLDDGFCAKTGEGFMYWTLGDRDVPVTIGAVALLSGDKVKSDANGAAVVVAADGDYYIGVMKVAGNPGEEGIIAEIVLGQQAS